MATSLLCPPEAGERGREGERREGEEEGEGEGERVGEREKYRGSERVSKLSDVSFHKDMNPIMWVPLSWPHLPKIPSPNTTTLGGRVST